MQETKYTKKLYKAIRKLNLDQEELKGLLLCLYINGCPSEDCAKLFGNTQEKIVSFLESEELYGYKACTKCSQLSDRINGFYQLKNRGHSICKECRIKHMKNYVKKTNYSKEYRKKNIEKLKKYDKKQKKEYYRDNKEKLNEKHKIYYEDNKEKLNKYGKEYRKNNKENIYKYNTQYYKNNKEKIKKNNKKYKYNNASIEQVQKLKGIEEVSGNQIRCKYCGRWMIPTIIQVDNRLQGIEENDRGYIYCSEECKQECPTYGQKKYPKGFKPASSREVNPMLRQLVLARDNYTCQKCGKSQDVRLHCHHIIPAVNSPIEANDPKNCITLCKDCHKLVHKLPGCGYNELKCA